MPLRENGCAARFARHLGSYEGAATVQHFMADRVVNELAALRPGRRFGRVLDLGCGTGLLSRRFGREFAWDELYLYDRVPGCGAYCRDLPRSSFHQLDLDAADSFPEAECVLSGACCQWLKDPERLFCAVAAALKRGGVFAGSAFTEGNFPELKSCGGAPVEFPQKEVWREMLEKAGLRLFRFAAEPVTLCFPSAAAALRHLRETGVLTPAFGTPGAARRFLRRYEEYGGVPGRVPLTYMPVYWTGVKMR